MATRAQQFEFLLAGVNDPDIPGAPLALGTVKFFEVGTTTPKDVWTESAKTNDYTEYTLDANGVAELYGDGSYKIELYDSGGSLEYTFDEVKCTASSYNRRVVSTSPITVTPDDDIIFVNTGSGNITLNLQDIALFSKPVTLKKISASNTVTYDAYSTQTIDGDLTGTMTANNDTVTLVPDTDSGQWRKTNHLATGLVGLTATVAELNQLDGNSFSKDGTTTIIDTGATTAEFPLDVLAENLDDDGNMGVHIGQAASTYNSILFLFHKTAADDSDNYLSIRIKGNPGIYLNGDDNLGVGALSTGAKLYVSGTSEITDTLTLSKASGNALVVTADADFNGNGDLAGVLTLSKASGNALVVTADVDFNGNQDLAGALNIGSGTTRKVGPKGTYVNNANGNPNISGTTLDVDATLAASTWESIGPTGSGADNTWTALDSVPYDAKWIKIRVFTYAADTNAVARGTNVYARATGSSETIGDDNKIASVAVQSDGTATSASNNITEATIPVDSSIRFDALWSSSASGNNVHFVLIGYDFNP